MRSEKSKETPPLPGTAEAKQECYSTQRRRDAEIAEISAEKTENRWMEQDSRVGAGGAEERSCHFGTAY
jgi:hypothetical protein